MKSCYVYLKLKQINVMGIKRLTPYNEQKTKWLSDMYMMKYLDTG